MNRNRKIGGASGLLGKLRGDVRGNVLALMAALLIPLTVLSGSAVDLARMYSVKTRLQQACDAGVLAGRKMMLDPTVTTLDDTASSAAQNFFRSNFREGWFKTTSVLFTPVKTTDNQVSGTATATVPMAIMNMFGMAPRTVSVTCAARYDVADADIMFVLDTTGSMACTTADDPCGAPAQSYTRPDGTTGYYSVEENGSKLSGLRAAVLSFYDTLAASADPTTHIRYGFVTYTSTVNVGYLLPTSNLVTAWNYQTRKLTEINSGSATNQTINGITSAACSAKVGRSPATGYDSSGQAVVTTFVSYTSSSSKCIVQNQTVLAKWTYDQYSLDVSQFITGASVADATKLSPTTSKWQGCIEERDTTTDTSFNVNALPPDLDPDLAPTSNATRWRPMWPDVVYYRSGTSSASSSGADVTTVNSPPANYTSATLPGNLQNGYHTCGKPAQRLTPMTRTDIANYVNATDFKAIGGTYHDTGMIWGTRLISPTGIFASDTAAWADHPGSPPNRYIVFMTDGQMAPNTSIYGMYGMEKLDQRVTGSGNSTTDLNNHNARFVAECAAAKARNITVFVIGFGQALNSQLTACASPGKAYFASDNATLKTKFQEIAQQVAMLRISQ